MTPPCVTTPVITKNPEDLAELHRLCAEGRLFDVEAWLRAGRPAQLALDVPVRTRKPISALYLAIEKGNHALVQLILRSGYDSSLERVSPFNIAFKVQRWDLVELLIEGGVNPHDFDRALLFETYNGDLFERFYQLGVDLTVGHELAATIGLSSSNRPLYGFVKRHRAQDAAIAFELQIALNSCIDEQNERGIALCLWAGANPRAVAPTINSINIYEDYKDAEPEERWLGRTALEEAVQRDNAALVRRFRPSKEDDIEALLDLAATPEIIEHLFSIALPKNTGRWLGYYRRWPGFWDDHGKGTAALWRKAFQCGLRWTESSAEEISAVRGGMLKASGYVFEELVRVLAEEDYCSSTVLIKLGRSDAFRRKLREHGFLPREDGGYAYRSRDARAIVQRYEVEPKPKGKPKVVVPRIVEIGCCGRRGLNTIDRRSLFELVWSEPVEKLAAKWGLSGRGVAKACARVKVPVPPRGYWARVQNGATVKRPKLPSLDVDYEPKILVPATDTSTVSL